MSEQIIEAMARAIWDALGGNHPWNDCFESTRENFRKDARAAFAALPLPCQHGQELLANLDRVANILGDLAGTQQPGTKMRAAYDAARAAIAKAEGRA